MLLPTIIDQQSTGWSSFWGMKWYNLEQNKKTNNNKNVYWCSLIIINYSQAQPGPLVFLIKAFDVVLNVNPQTSNYCWDGTIQSQIADFVKSFLKPFYNVCNLRKEKNVSFYEKIIWKNLSVSPNFWAHTSGSLKLFD